MSLSKDKLLPLNLSVWNSTTSSWDEIGRFKSIQFLHPNTNKDGDTKSEEFKAEKKGKQSLKIVTYNVLFDTEEVGASEYKLSNLIYTAKRRPFLLRILGDSVCQTAHF